MPLITKNVRTFETCIVLTRLGVDSGVQQLSAIEISDLITNRVSDDDIADKTRHFQNTYTTLRDSRAIKETRQC